MASAIIRRVSERGTIRPRTRNLRRLVYSPGGVRWTILMANAWHRGRVTVITQWANPDPEAAGAAIDLNPLSGPGDTSLTAAKCPR